MYILRKVQDVLFELHEGSCGSHVGDRSLAHRARSQNYWWPYMQKDALAYTSKYDKCQKHTPIIHQSGTKLHPLTSPRPISSCRLKNVLAYGHKLLHQMGGSCSISQHRRDKRQEDPLAKHYNQIWHHHNDCGRQWPPV